MLQVELPMECSLLRGSVSRSQSCHSEENSEFGTLRDLTFYCHSDMLHTKQTILLGLPGLGLSAHIPSFEKFNPVPRRIYRK